MFRIYKVILYDIRTIKTELKIGLHSYLDMI